MANHSKISAEECEKAWLIQILILLFSNECDHRVRSSPISNTVDGATPSWQIIDTCRIFERVPSICQSLGQIVVVVGSVRHHVLQEPEVQS
jgi:hypothetical protein